MNGFKQKCARCGFAALVSLGALRCFAAPDDWTGTWKLNESKSSIPGPSFSITVPQLGEYRYDNGTYSFSFRCDGKEYPTTSHHTISCTQTGSTTIDATLKANSANIGTAHWVLSANGQMLTIKAASVQPDGSRKIKENFYMRVSGNVGFAGGWKDKERLTSRQLFLALNDRQLHIAFAERAEYADLPLDGSDAEIHGRAVPEGLTMAIRRGGPQEFLTIKKFKGKIVNQGSLRLSADGHTLLEEYWRPDRPDQRAVLVYERQ